MTIVDKIAKSVEAIETEQGCGRHMPFIYDDEDMQNIRFDMVQAPLVAAVPIESAAVEDAGGVIRERLTIAIWFADAMVQATAGDFDARLNEHVIDACKKRAFRWAASLSPAKDLRLVSINGSIRAYLRHDSYLTGYMLNVTLEEVDGISRCNV